jgi:2,5-diketo-D-gluconate reductase A
VFVTTKFNGQWHGFAEAQQAFANSARRLGLESIDLLLIHWPLPGQGKYVEAWKGLIKLLEEGKVRAIGVSNFKPSHLDRIIEATGVAPHVNQVQLHPRIAKPAERAYHAAHGIVTESWSPIGRGQDLLAEPAVTEAALKHSRTPAQVVLRWHVQLGLIPIPKSADPRRMAENLAVFDFALTEAEMARISALDRKGEGAADSDRVGH